MAIRKDDFPEPTSEQIEEKAVHDLRTNLDIAIREEYSSGNRSGVGVFTRVQLSQRRLDSFKKEYEDVGWTVKIWRDTYGIIYIDIK